MIRPILTNGTVPEFIRTRIGRILSSGSPRVHFYFRLPTTSPLTGDALERLMKELRRLVSREELPFITRRSLLWILKIRIGDSPFLSGYFPIFVGGPKRAANADGNIVASSRAGAARGNTPNGVATMTAPSHVVEKIESGSESEDENATAEKVAERVEKIMYFVSNVYGTDDSRVFTKENKPYILPP